MMRTLLALLFCVHAAWSADIGALVRQYGRDDQRLATALRYERVKDGVREQVWVTEAGDVLKVSREATDPKAATLEEISLDADDDVYFSFRKTTAAQPGGGTLVTEERAFFEPFKMLQKTRRSATFAAGAEAVIPEKAPLEKLDIAALSEDERRGAPQYRILEEILRETHAQEHLVFDPAKDAPEEWKRVKVVQKSASPDGRYGLAFAPAKEKFDWEEYRGPEGIGGYWADGEDVRNFIVDFKTRHVLGKTPGEHFGTRQRYNHRENTMAWAPDSSAFIQLTSTKWSYEVCCAGRIVDGKLAQVENIGAAVTARAKKFLIAQKNADYRRHAAGMVTAIYGPVMENGGTGSVDVVFQVPKEVDIRPVRVRFRLGTGKGAPQFEVLGAAYAPDNQ